MKEPGCTRSGRLALVVRGAIALSSLTACPTEETPPLINQDGGSVTDAIVPTIPDETCRVSVPCGGEIYGTWVYSSGCITGEHQAIQAECPAAGYELNFSVLGTLIFGLDGTFSNDISVGLSGRLVLPASCYPADAPITPAQCRDIGRGIGLESTCSLDGAGACFCDFREFPTRQKSAGTFQSGGGQLYLDEQAYEYCVSGDFLTIRGLYDEGLFSVMTLVRKE